MRRRRSHRAGRLPKSPLAMSSRICPIHDRGAKVQAATVRAYMNAAFAYGLRSENDCTRQDAGARRRLTSDPITAIPVADGLSNPRNRFLSPTEGRTFWTWPEAYDIDSGLD